MTKYFLHLHELALEVRPLKSFKFIYCFLKQARYGENRPSCALLQLVGAAGAPASQCVGCSNAGLL